MTSLLRTELAIRRLSRLYYECPQDFPERRMLGANLERLHCERRVLERQRGGDKFLDRPTSPPDVLTMDAARSLYRQIRESSTKTDAAQRETDAVRRDLQRLQWNMETLNRSVVDLHNLMEGVIVTDGA